MFLIRSAAKSLRNTALSTGAPFPFIVAHFLFISCSSCRILTLCICNPVSACLSGFQWVLQGERISFSLSSSCAIYSHRRQCTAKMIVQFVYPLSSLSSASSINDVCYSLKNSSLSFFVRLDSFCSIFGYRSLNINTAIPKAADGDRLDQVFLLMALYNFFLTRQCALSRSLSKWKYLLPSRGSVCIQWLFKIPLHLKIDHISSSADQRVPLPSFSLHLPGTVALHFIFQEWFFNRNHILRYNAMAPSC